MTDETFSDPKSGKQEHKVEGDTVIFHGNAVFPRTIIVESPDRFARDLAVQLTGHDYLKSLGVSLVPASAPDIGL